LYSTLINERDIVSWFLIFQEIDDYPNITN